MMEALISSPVFGNLRREPQVLQRMMPREVITRLQLAGDDGLRFSDRRALCCESPLSRGGGLRDPIRVDRGPAVTPQLTCHPRRTAHRSYSPCSIMFVKISEYAEISACLQAVHQVSQTTSSVARSVAVKLCLVAPPLHTSRGRGEGAAAPLRSFSS